MSFSRFGARSISKRYAVSLRPAGVTRTPPAQGSSSRGNDRLARRRPKKRFNYFGRDQNRNDCPVLCPRAGGNLVQSASRFERFPFPAVARGSSSVPPETALGPGGPHVPWTGETCVSLWPCRHKMRRLWHSSLNQPKKLLPLSPFRPCAATPT